MSRLTRIAEEAVNSLLENDISNGEFSYSNEIIGVWCTEPPEDVIEAVSKSTQTTSPESTPDTSNPIICINKITIDSGYLRYGFLREFIQALSRLKGTTHICMKIDNNESYSRRMAALPDLALINGYKLLGFHIKVSGYELYAFSKE
jgi:hypothetical protein